MSGNEELLDKVMESSRAAKEQGLLDAAPSEPFVLEIKRSAEGMKYALNESFRPIVRTLIRKYQEDELKGAKGQTDEILFIVNSSERPKKNGSPKIATLGKIPGKFADILWQITGHHFNYILTYYSAWMPAANENQVVAVLYHELRHIDGMGGIREHDINDWSEMYRRLGVNWHAIERSPISAIPK